MPRPLNVLAAWLIAVLAALLPAAAPAATEEGVNVGKPSAVRNLVPAEQLERQSAQQYGALKRQAADARALAPDGHPQVQRLRAIVMGHEIAHALREHARERMAKSGLAHLGAGLLGQVVARGKFASAIEAGGSLLALKFSRDNESKADAVGLDLAARAGFNPRAGVTLWQKMSQAGRGGPPQWLSTHPSGPNRIRDIEKHLPEVLPLYDKTREKAGGKTSSPASAQAKPR